MVRMADILKKIKAEKERERLRKAKGTSSGDTPSEEEPAKTDLKPSAAGKAETAPGDKSTEASEGKKEGEETRKSAGERNAAVDPQKEKGKAASVPTEPKSTPGGKEDKYSYRQTLELYDSAINVLSNLLKEDIDYASVDVEEIYSCVEAIINQTKRGNTHLLYLAFARDFRYENYLPYHSVNVCIYSLEIAMGLGYDDDKLTELGILSLLHDVKMIEHIALVNKPRKLTEEERELVKRHPRESAEAAEKLIKDTAGITFSAILQHHERMDGSGYPEGLTGEDINEFAKIINLVDTYEAKIHPRSYRENDLASKCLQEIIDDKPGFEYKLVKALIQRVGVYPIGSIVKLSTKEVGEIIKVRHDNPICPVVKILFKSSGRQVTEEKIVDMKYHPEFSIRRELKRKDLVSKPA